MLRLRPQHDSTATSTVLAAGQKGGPLSFEGGPPVCRTALLLVAPTPTPAEADAAEEQRYEKDDNEKR